MNEQKAREILGGAVTDTPDGEAIYDGYNYARWAGYEDTIVLDGDFTPECLEAIAWWMKNKRIPTHA